MLRKKDQLQLGTGAPIRLGAAALAAWVGWQSWRTKQEKQSCLPPGQIYKINGQSIHGITVGEGPVTIVIDSGLGGYSADWLHVWPQLVDRARVFLFDRPGLGWSDPAPGPRTSLVMMRELTQLLDMARIEGPLILVGMSLGAFNMRLFAHQFPQRVAAAVLVDGAHEQIIDHLPQRFLFWLRQSRWLRYPARLSGQLGFPRFLMSYARRQAPEVPGHLFRDLPREQWDLLSIPRSWPSYTETILREMAGFAAGADVVQAARRLNPRPFGDKPLTVISANVAKSAARFRLFARFSEEGYRTSWSTFQQDQLLLSSNSRFLHAEHSGHAVMYDQPEIVVTALNDILDHYPRPT